MPTGYTAGILDGKITTFPQFAKQCMRAFGAVIHMRDEDMDAEYKERTPSDYHYKEIERANQLYKDAQTLSDKQIISGKKKELEESKKYHLEKIEKEKVDRKAMNVILDEVRKWQPPTPEHTGIKDFMIDQIVKTIDFDCDSKYHTKALQKIEYQLLNLNAESIRRDMKEKAAKDLAYHTKEHNEELKHCEKSNKWVADLLNSI